jgi:hypothetical protein
MRNLATTMFVRFRETGQRLQVSLVEARRLYGQTRQDHVAGLGSIRTPPSPADRLAFWTKLHQRLSRLANRIDSATHGTILAAVHARIPMPIADDQRAVQLENARADVRFWAGLSEAHSAEVADSKAMLANVTRSLSEREASAAKSADAAKIAAERLARVERGEDVGGIGKPLTHADLVKATGWKPSDFRHAARLIEIEEIGAHNDLMADTMKRQLHAEKAAARAILRRRRQ